MAVLYALNTLIKLHKEEGDKKEARVRTNCLDFVALLTSNSASLQSTEEGRDDTNTQIKGGKN